MDWVTIALIALGCIGGGIYIGISVSLYTLRKRGMLKEDDNATAAETPN